MLFISAFENGRFCVQDTDDNTEDWTDASTLREYEKLGVKIYGVSPNRIFVPMKNKETRKDFAQTRCLECLDYITETYVDPDYVEVTGKMGGDILTYRVYNNGNMYSR